MTARDNIPAPLLERFRRVCAESSDINEHLGTLYGLAWQCEHVTEFGVRGGNSATALLAAQPNDLWLIDRDECPVVNKLYRLRGRTHLFSLQQDSRDIDIEPTDLLHIDTIRAYSCLSVELQHHASRVSRYIAMHDTEVYGRVGDDGGEGMNKAIEELVAGGQWRVLMHFTHNHGMTVLQRIASE